MKPKTKKLLKLAAKWEAANIAIWLLTGRPKRPNGSAKSLSLILNLTDGVAANASVQKVIAQAPTFTANLEIGKTTTKPVGLIMWDGLHTDYGSQSNPPYDKLINQASLARVKLSRLKEAGIHLVPFYGRQNLPPQNVEVYDNMVYNESLGRNVYDTLNIPVTVDFTYNQAAMDKQIAYAAQAGFSYLAFCHYATESPASEGRRMFVNSAKKGKMKMCYIMPSLGYNPSQTVAEIVHAMRQPYYQRINGKPILIFQDRQIEAYNLIRAALGSDIYRVGFNANDLYNYPTNLNNFDAGSTYCTVGYGFGSNHDYNGIIAQSGDAVRNFISANPTKKVVPNLTTGFGNYQKLNPLDRPGYVNRATDAQLTQAILQFKQQLASSAADTGLVYAGNEFLENDRCVFPVFNADGSLNLSTLNLFIKYL